jgi:hypothetical protein
LDFSHWNLPATLAGETGLLLRFYSTSNGVKSRAIALTCDKRDHRSLIGYRISHPAFPFLDEDELPANPVRVKDVEGFTSLLVPFIGLPIRMIATNNLNELEREESSAFALYSMV